MSIKNLKIFLSLSVVFNFIGVAHAKTPLDKIKDEGMLSPIHTKYAGKIVFSKSFINRSLNDDSNFVTSFSLSDKIFMRPLMKESLMNSMLSQGLDCGKNRYGQSVKLQVNDAPEEDWLELYSHYFSDNNFREDTTVIWYTPAQKSVNKEPFWGGPVAFDNEAIKLLRYHLTVAISRLKPGTHKLKFHHYAWCSGVGTAKASEGEFTLKVTAKELASVIDKFGPKFPESKNSEAKQLIPVYTANYQVPGGGTIKKVAMPSNEWAYETNPLTGAYTKRKIEFLVGYQREEGLCFITEALAVHGVTDPKEKKFAPNASYFNGDPFPFPCQSL